MTDTKKPAADTTTAPQLLIQDIIGAAQCIQLASQRGAFQAGELSQVGGIYDRLVAFLQASGALAPAAGTTTPSADSAEPTESN